jgi:hypothetical protein
VLNLNIYGFAMAIIYVGAGIFLLTGSNIFSFSKLQQISFASILIAYGSFRFYTAINKRKNLESNGDE